jgi:hypothetical protein
VINIEVGEGLLEVALGDHVFHLKASHDELCEVNEARTVSVNYTHQQAHAVLRNGRLDLKAILKLYLADDPVVISIKVFKDLDKVDLFFSIKEL